MKRFRKITIIGVGLIGGSIGLAIKRKRLADEVVGVFRHKSTLSRALKCKAIDRGVSSIRDGVRGADLVIVATPVHSIPAITKEAARYVKKNTIITDVGSTKDWIVANIEKGLGGSTKVFFVGSHPMAGSDHTGVEFARPTLLDKTPCIVTKTAKTNSRALKTIANFWKALGAKVEIMSPASHDKHITMISHLPHLVAFAIAGAVPESDLIYAAEGFKDTTRVASSDPGLWADIFLTNKKKIIDACRMFEAYYKDIIKSLSKDDYTLVVKLLAKAKAKRDKFVHEK